MRVYNQLGRRDNKYKARIKILVKAMGAEAFAARVEKEWQFIKDNENTLNVEAVNRVKAFFIPHNYESIDDQSSNTQLQSQRLESTAFSRWLDKNVQPHKQPGYAMVNLALERSRRY